jgi:hypothetical protein
MTEDRRQSAGVRAWLSVDGGTTARVSVTTAGEVDLLRVQLVVTATDRQPVTIELDPAAAAYLGGALAVESGVTFG